MRALLRSIGFVVAGLLLTAVIGSVRQPRSYSALASEESRENECRERRTDLADATLRGDVRARDRMLREMPEACSIRS